ncbi:hypothetical protein NHX12_033290 [Muraenolepis orangiensis]|uniref:Phosphatidylinositol-glycan biosynthesis class X protein n=1 Tax=Muraenolepis orangiensis TaxID=630683 RepID=A0A9Q0E7C0_9TELE|nr:hypothetical protein NHX12_033290 [Muraenolepis orangiensis]
MITSMCVYLSGGEKDPHVCGLGRQWLESVLVSTDIHGKGFHRDLVTTVKFSPAVPDVLNLLLVHKLPSGIYVDPYQLASLSGDSHLQILLDSAIDLEAPAHRTRGFAALVFALLVTDGSSNLLKMTVPIHCRYHEPSLGEDKTAYVSVAPPDLLVRSGTCK